MKRKLAAVVIHGVVVFTFANLLKIALGNNLFVIITFFKFAVSPEVHSS